MPNLVVTIPPAKPQGSKRGFLINGRIVMVEATKDLKVSRNFASELIRQAALNWRQPTKDTPMSVTLVFTYQKPKTVKRLHHTVTPDLDKLVRYCLDAVTVAGNVWHDDSQVNALTAIKVYGTISETRIEIEYEN
jgi:Holliday junction resolvase RusA-like endonuclease